MSGMVLAHQALDVGSAEGALRSTAFTLECISRILAAAAHHTEAARLLGACDAFRTQRGSIRYPCLQRLLDLSAGTSRDALGDEEFDAAVGEGATLSLEAAADYCRRLRVAHNTTRVGWDAFRPLGLGSNTILESYSVAGCRPGFRPVCFGSSGKRMG